METAGQARQLPAAHAPKSKPDPRPMRLALGAGGVAALSALAAAIVLPPQYQAAVQQQQPADPNQQAAGQLSTDPSPTPRPVLYIQLAPGQTAPPGATVIDASGVPGAGTGGGTTTGKQPVVTQGQKAVPTAKPTPKKTPAPIKTTQSGKVKP
jgi:hypothetical protein